MSNPKLFLLSAFCEKEGHRTIRLCIPGIDKGGAVYLESEIEGDEAYCAEVLKKIHNALPSTEIEIDPRD
jgi:hypothetical protein